MAIFKKSILKSQMLLLFRTCSIIYFLPFFSKLSGFVYVALDQTMGCELPKEQQNYFFVKHFSYLLIFTLLQGSYLFFFQTIIFLCQTAISMVGTVEPILVGCSLRLGAHFPPNLQFGIFNIIRNSVPVRFAKSPTAN